MNSKKNKKSAHKNKKHVKQNQPSGNAEKTDAAASVTKVVDEEEDKENLPYVIETSDVMGRYLVAAHDLAPGALLMTEKPLVVGPCQGCKPMCLGCYKGLEINKHTHRCKKCGWPMCGEQCPGMNREYGHSSWECNLLSSSKVKSCILGCETYGSILPHYYAIVPLRCLLLKTNSPEKWKTLITMESHNELRQKLPDLWRANQELVVDRITKKWVIEDFPEADIHNICGILEVNAFEVGQNGVSVRALYPNAFYMAHDCVPNTCHTDDQEYNLSVRTASAIRKGFPITLSYAYTLQGTLKRRDHLKESKFFDCCCKRCSDPTELGTYAGALKCPKCDSGYVLSSAPLQTDAPWRCSNNGSERCTGYSVTARSVRLLMDRIGDEVESNNGNDVGAFEDFLQKYRNVLHPNHYHFLGVKHTLSQLYGKIDGYMMNEMPERLVLRKRDICQDLLQLFNILEPGYSRLRGIVLYELHAPLMILITRGFEASSISKRDLPNRLSEVANCLEESSIILGFEPDNSSEEEMGTAAKNALVRVQDWQRIVGKG